MEILRELIYYHQEDFYSLCEEYENRGFEIYSISKFLKGQILENSSFEDLDNIVVDISALPMDNIDNNLIVIEQLIPRFHENTIFIAKSKFNKIELDLVHCFENFTIYNNSNSQAESKHSNKIKRIVDLSEDELDIFFEAFESKLYGHKCFKKDFRMQLKMFRVFNSVKEHKILSFFLMGESGIGKTEVAKSIHKGLKSEKSLVKINFGSYSSHDALNNLIGSPRGYMGSDGGELFDRVKKSDTGVILIDEFEKANLPVYNYFLDLLETGVAVNSLGDELDLDGYIIVFTSNIDKNSFGHYFSPELRSRFDYKTYFKHLSKETKSRYVKNRLEDIFEKYNQSQEIAYSQETVENLSRSIEIEKYINMRDLNRKVKEVFVNHIHSED